MNNKLIAKSISFFRDSKELNLAYANLSELDISLEIEYPKYSNDSITVYCYSSNDGKTIGLDINKETGDVFYVNSVDKVPEFKHEDFIFPENSIKATPNFSINDFDVDERFQDIGIYDFCGIVDLVIYNNAISFIFGDLNEGSIDLMPSKDLLFKLSADGALSCIISRLYCRSSIQHLL